MNLVNHITISRAPNLIHVDISCCNVNIFENLNGYLYHFESPFVLKSSSADIFVESTCHAYCVELRMAFACGHY